MALSPKQVGLIRQSFDVLRKNPQRRSVEFYEAFFARAPEARAMFRADLEGQGMRFMTTLSMILDHLDRDGGMGSRLEDLGRAHRAMGVSPQQFEPMAQAFVETIGTAMGEAFTPDMQAAWDAAFIEIAALMIERGGIGED